MGHQIRRVRGGTDCEGKREDLSSLGLWWAFDGFEDNQLPDGQIADHAMTTLQKLRANRDNGDHRRFFLAVGFHKPVE